MSPSATSSGLERQARDLDLLRDLFVSRLMTLGQAAAIHFSGKSEMAKKRMQKLKAAGMVGERVRKPYEPSILYLTRIGFDTLRDRGCLQDLPQLAWSNVAQRLQVSDLTLRHELEVMTTKAAFFTAAREHETIAISEFTTWPTLYQFQSVLRDGSELLVKPDGFIRIREHIEEDLFEHIFYLELDRSTETLDTLARKAQAYLAYYQSGGLAERFGHDRSQFKDFPFRVLMVFKTAERRNNMAERLLAGSPPILTHVWLATSEDVMASPLGPVWVRPRDYREAVAGSGYESGSARGANAYRRDAERDRHVESRVQRQPLLETDAASDQP